MTAMLGSMLTPKAGPRFYVRPPLCRSHNAKGHLPQSLKTPIAKSNIPDKTPPPVMDWTKRFTGKEFV